MSLELRSRSIRRTKDVCGSEKKILARPSNKKSRKEISCIQENKKENKKKGNCKGRKRKSKTEERKAVETKWPKCVLAWPVRPSLKASRKKKKVKRSTKNSKTGAKKAQKSEEEEKKEKEEEELKKGGTTKEETKENETAKEEEETKETTETKEQNAKHEGDIHLRQSNIEAIEKMQRDCECDFSSHTLFGFPAKLLSHNCLCWNELHKLHCCQRFTVLQYRCLMCKMLGVKVPDFILDLWELNPQIERAFLAKLTQGDQVIVPSNTCLKWAWGIPGLDIVWVIPQLAQAHIQDWFSCLKTMIPVMPSEQALLKKIVAKKQNLARQFDDKSLFNISKILKDLNALIHQRGFLNVHTNVHDSCPEGDLFKWRDVLHQGARFLKENEHRHGDFFIMLSENALEEEIFDFWRLKEMNETLRMCVSFGVLLKAKQLLAISNQQQPFLTVLESQFEVWRWFRISGFHESLMELERLVKEGKGKTEEGKAAASLCETLLVDLCEELNAIACLLDLPCHEEKAKTLLLSLAL